MNNKSIGVFDSGVGGLSILKELKKLLPKENYIFFADQKHVPYGNKTKKELEELTDKILSFFVSENVKENLRNSFILSDVMGSDHCPIGLELLI